MLHSYQKRDGMPIVAAKEEADTVKGYTGGRRSNRRVLVPSCALRSFDWQGRVFQVNLTRELSEGSRRIDAATPASRLHEAWPVRDLNGGMW